MASEMVPSDEFDSDLVKSVAYIMQGLREYRASIKAQDEAAPAIESAARTSTDYLENLSDVYNTLTSIRGMADILADVMNGGEDDEIRSKAWTIVPLIFELADRGMDQTGL